MSLNKRYLFLSVIFPDPPVELLASESRRIFLAIGLLAGLLSGPVGALNIDDSFGKIEYHALHVTYMRSQWGIAGVF